jgi:hypothetical protein
MADTRIKHASTMREAEAFRDEFITQGYKVESAGENTTIVKKSTWGSTAGHIGVALFTIWWTFGLGNLVYALIVHKSDEVMIKVDLPPVTE